jgi:ArsR family transcriptional regulator
MNQNPIFELQAELCRALGHPLRLELIHILSDGPKRVGELVHVTGYAQGTVSRHLAVLRSNGIVMAHHHGRGEILYQMADPRIPAICDLMRQFFIEQTARKSQALKRLDEANQ